MDKINPQLIEYQGKTSPKFLLVDDKPENLVALKVVLKGLDVELITATSGNEALKQTLNHEFALALLDVQMPEMDGYELAELLRSDERTSEIPIIFISAIFTDKLNIFKGYEKGAFSFITKPFKPQELLNKIDFFIDKYHTEQAFDESQKKYMDLYNNSPDMLLSVDLETETIKECNETLINNTGYKKEELINQPMLAIYTKDSAEKAHKAYQSFLNEGKEITNLEVAIKTKSKGPLSVLLNATGLRDISGKYIYSNTSLRDISELKQTKKELEVTLEKVQLYNKELENLVYLTSHDLQEPMLTVMSFIQLLEEEYKDQLDKDAMDYIFYCMQAANRMKELITSLLDYLRIGTNSSPEVINLKSLVKEVQQEMRGVILQSEAKITVQDLPKLNVDKSEMKHLFQNLISNGIKFKKKNNKPEITIGSTQTENEWIFSVADNGIGIDSKHHDKVFQIFKQLHERGKYSGMGMGMSVCKKIIELHGGRMWLDSAPNKGTTFYFSIPS